MQRSLVVPLDGSLLAEHAVPYATALARRLDTRLILLHARWTAVLPDESAPDLEAIARRVRTGGIEVETHTCHMPSEEEAGRAILDAATDLGASMVVIATHGRGGLGRMIYGSVADQILRQATLPVVLISPGCERPFPAEGPFRILVPLDGSEFSEEILPPLKALASVLPVELLVLRVAETIEPRLHGDECVRCRLMRARGEEPDLEYVKASRYADEIADRLRREGAIVTAQMVVGNAPATIARVAQERDVDLIAMATHGRSGLARLVMGSVATATLRQADRPMLLIRPAAVRQPGRAEDERAATLRTRRRLTVEDIMSAPVATLPANATLEEVASLMLDRAIGAVPIVDDSGALQGIVTESDFTGKEGFVPFSTFKLPQLFGEWMPREGVEAIYHAARTRTAGDIMSTPVITAIEDEPVSDLARRMVEDDIKRLPVVRGAVPVGMVTRHDLLRLMLLDDDDVPRTDEPLTGAEDGRAPSSAHTATSQPPAPDQTGSRT